MSQDTQRKEVKEEAKETRLSITETPSPQEVQIPPSYECPITCDIMQDPYVAADGHSYEGVAIKEWFSTGRKISPMTGAQLPHQGIIPNINLKQSIQTFLQARPALNHNIKQAAEYRNLKAVVALREQDLAEMLLKQRKAEEHHKMVETSLSSSLARLGISAPETHQAQLQLGREVLTFVEHMQAHLDEQRGATFDQNAALSFAGAVISAILKGPEAYTAMLDHPELHSLNQSPTLVPFIREYINAHETLWKLADSRSFASQVKRDFYAGMLIN